MIEWVRIEGSRASVKPGMVHQLDAFEIASRLSFFLWSSLPDEELLARALLVGFLGGKWSFRCLPYTRQTPTAHVSRRGSGRYALTCSRIAARAAETRVRNENTCHRFHPKSALSEGMEISIASRTRDRACGCC